MIIVDSNILIDVIENDPLWSDWSDYQLTLLGQVLSLVFPVRRTDHSRNRPRFLRSRANGCLPRSVNDPQGMMAD